MKKKIKKGFTLVELLVVMAILAILSTVSVVGYLGFTEKAKESNAKTEMAQVQEVVRGMLLDGSTYCVKEGDAHYSLSLDGGKVIVSPCSDASHSDNKHSEKTLEETFTDLKDLNLSVSVGKITLLSNGITLDWDCSKPNN